MVWIALAIVYVVWGSTFFAIALVVHSMPPLLAAGARFMMAGLILGVIIALRDRRALRVGRRQLVGAAAVGTLLLAGGNGLVTLGERTVPSGLAALIIASIPLWVVILRLAFGERIGRDILAGVGVGILGVGILVVPNGITGQIELLPLLLLVLAALFWASGSFLSQRIAMPLSVWGSAVYQQIAAGIVLIGFGTLFGEARAVDASRFTTESLFGLAYLVVFGSLVAFSAYTWLLQNAPVSLVSTYAYVNPVIAVFLGTLFLAEPITPTMIAGAALILAAVAFTLQRLNSARVASRAAEAA